MFHQVFVDTHGFDMGRGSKVNNDGRLYAQHAEEILWLASHAVLFLREIAELITQKSSQNLRIAHSLWIMPNMLTQDTNICLFSFVLIAGTSPQKSISAGREQVPFTMAIGNWELMQECFPKHPRMGTAR